MNTKLDRYHQNRRLYPRIYNTDYVLLKELREVLKTAIRKHLSEQGKESKLIDYGCGDIPYKTLFEDYVSEYIGCDIDSNKFASFIVGQDGTVPIEDGTMDIILSTQVLEHVHNIDKYLNEANRLLRKGGLVFLSTNQFWPYHPHPSDLRRWTLDGLRYEMEEHGFKVIDSHGIVGMLAFSSQLRVIFFQELLKDKGLIGKILLAMISSIYQILMLVEERMTSKDSLKKNAAIYFVVGQK